MDVIIFASIEIFFFASMTRFIYVEFFSKFFLLQIVVIYFSRAIWNIKKNMFL